MRILLVDDDEMSLAIMRSLLTTAGHDVRIARDGMTALGMLHRSACRLVITDWSMPVMSGIGLCRSLRARSWPHGLHIILLSAFDDATHKAAASDAGADAFLVKPFDPAELMEHVHRAERSLLREPTQATRVLCQPIH